MKAPNNYWLEEDGTPTLTSPEGLKAAEAHVRSLQWTSKDNLTWGWAEQYGAMANLQASMAMTFTNMAGINDKLKAAGQVAYTDSKIFAATANLQFHPVKNLLIEPEVSYTNWDSIDRHAWAGILRFQRSF